MFTLTVDLTYNILQTTISFIEGVKHYLLNTYYPQ